ncbi:MAG: tyrosine-type recombinase/integrase [Actinomycetota bacterium]|jgi:integrase|nr:tyrosine-type recombinase/integrase [Actinomycetota bacterium]MDA8357573.1 tyrosine-type recombinase/integrase [Actinomycetota bacterium]
MTDFSLAAEDYLVTRRAMGYKLSEQGRLLRQFVAYLEDRGAEHLTIADAVSWATQPPDGAMSWWAFRLGVVRPFARYLSTLDAITEVPPAGLLPEPNHRIVPYIYSDDDLEQVLDAAGRLAPEHRADTYKTLICLVAVTGMRCGEAVRLDRDDVDLDEGLLTIRNSKFNKSRQVPVHPTTVVALRAYAERRDRRRPKPKAPSFFTSAIGTRLLRDNVSTVFPRLVREAGLGRGASGRLPRMHDLRHTFAVKCVIGWYRAGVDVDARLPLLSTFLGHVSPRETYWYLTGVPELLELAMEQMDHATAGATR